jgi:hypothetical protein
MDRLNHAETAAMGRTILETMRVSLGLWRQGCSTLSTEGPLEECVDPAESGGVAILIER